MPKKLRPTAKVLNVMEVAKSMCRVEVNVQ